MFTIRFRGAGEVKGGKVRTRMLARVNTSKATFPEALTYAAKILADQGKDAEAATLRVDIARPEAVATDKVPEFKLAPRSPSGGKGR